MAFTVFGQERVLSAAIPEITRGRIFDEVVINVGDAEKLIAVSHFRLGELLNLDKVRAHLLTADEILSRLEKDLGPNPNTRPKAKPKSRATRLR